MKTKSQKRAEATEPQTEPIRIKKTVKMRLKRRGEKWARKNDVYAMTYSDTLEELLNLTEKM